MQKVFDVGRELKERERVDLLCTYFTIDDVIIQDVGYGIENVYINDSGFVSSSLEEFVATYEGCNTMIETRKRDVAQTYFTAFGEGPFVFIEC